MPPEISNHSPPTGDFESSAAEPQTQYGERVGPYKLLQRLGTGGMGELWMAEQSAPVRRQVAVKLIRPNLAADHWFGRFEIGSSFGPIRIPIQASACYRNTDQAMDWSAAHKGH